MDLINYLVADESLLERMVEAVEEVRDRLRRAAALESARLPYAVAAWVATIDEGAVRNTQGVDILLRLVDLSAARGALEGAGFSYRHVAGIDMFLDGPTAKARDAVRIVFAAEKVRPEYLEPAPDVDAPIMDKDVRILPLEALVRMKLMSFRDKDRTHLRDMIEVGLIDASWSAKPPSELAAGLQQLLSTPER